MTHKSRLKHIPLAYGAAALFVVPLGRTFAAAADSQNPGTTARFDGSLDKLADEPMRGRARGATRPNETIVVEAYDEAPYFLR